MNLLAEIKVSGTDMRNTIYVPIIVDAKDGGEAQRKAMEVAQAEYPASRVSGGTVYNATPESIADGGRKVRHEAPGSQGQSQGKD
jgi:hypothetical protein